MAWKERLSKKASAQPPAADDAIDVGMFGLKDALLSGWFEGDELFRGMPISADDVVVDVGCGEGTTTYFMAKQLPQASVVGIDFSAAGIAMAREQYRVKNLRFEHDEDNSTLGSTFDLVTAFEVLEHLPEIADTRCRQGLDRPG